ncbi:MAG: septum formation protein Maf [Candidatus Aureabacteria bacterium]|nr:septum formation protein Maf [Candidatus Auribacterota bacterium]NLW93007.1 septum formation protein Maf [Chlamydiota bacterium]HQM52170.1 Maf family protein [bacterium]
MNPSPPRLAATRRPVILASRSRARKALLRQIGLRFRTAAPRVREAETHRDGSAAMVVANARAKALDVARRRRTGLVIAADTVVTARGKVIGKPANLAEARKTLRLLSRSPQQVLTGVAVADIDRGTVRTACVKTLVVMRPMGDREIGRYLRKVSPLDLAGSFDIQGLGALFVERVEGCYFNVVGLPLAALARLLRETGIELP